MTIKEKDKSKIFKKIGNMLLLHINIRSFPYIYEISKKTN